MRVVDADNRRFGVVLIVWQGAHSAVIVATRSTCATPFTASSSGMGLTLYRHGYGSFTCAFISDTKGSSAPTSGGGSARALRPTSLSLQRLHRTGK